MKHSNIGALAAALWVTGTLALSPALADDTAVAAKAAVTAALPAETSRNHAADAHKEAVAQATHAMRSATKLELDIRLVAHKSVLVATDRL
jgi:hypothetical protein